MCDAFDALVTDRPYRPGRSVDEAVRELCRCAGTQFDVRVVKAFVAEILGDGAAGRAATGVLA